MVFLIEQSIHGSRREFAPWAEDDHLLLDTLERVDGSGTRRWELGYERHEPLAKPAEFVFADEERVHEALHSPGNYEAGWIGIPLRLCELAHCLRPSEGKHDHLVDSKAGEV